MKSDVLGAWYKGDVVCVCLRCWPLLLVLSRIGSADGLLMLPRPIMGTRSHMQRHLCIVMTMFGSDP
jgi:hypothetical protein